MRRRSSVASFSGSQHRAPEAHSINQRCNGCKEINYAAYISIDIFTKQNISQTQQHSKKQNISQNVFQKLRGRFIKKHDNILYHKTQ